MTAASPWPAGLVTALVTPLRDDAVDSDALGRLIDDQIANGAAGLVVSGGTGEYGTLSREERLALIRDSVRLADGRVPVIAATACLSTRETVQLSQAAEASGVTGLLLASSYGEAISWTERYAYYVELDSRLTLPVMIYNTPSAGLLSFQQIRQLSELRNISAVKDSSGDPELMGDLVAWAKETGFGVYVGKDSFLFEAIVTGALGAVFGAANFMPAELSHLIADLQAGGEIGTALEAWRRIRPLLRLMEHASNYVGLCKAGCRLRGIDVGEVRPPYAMPGPDEVARLAASLDNLRTT